MDQLKRYWPCLFIGTIWLWLFWPILSGQQVVGFRDSAYLYYPLFQWIDAQWAEGVLPLWNPYCNHGMPVVHDGSSSVFYPGKLIFFLRALPYPARYGIYVAMHIPIAAAGTYWFARTLRTQQTGATLSAVAYAFSGPILFQTTNVVYLVSASWLPFALCSVWMMYRRRSIRWSIWTAVFCSLMILGGDPQMCYHVGIIMVAFGLWEYFRERQRKLRIQNNLRDKRPSHVGLRCLFLVLTTVLVTSGLAAIQILPSYVWASQSIRNDFHDPTNHERSVPRNIYETAMHSSKIPGGPQRVQETTLEGIYGEPIQGTHHDHLYQFSQPPWTLAELVWPNVSGKPFPINQRWIDGLAGAERMWTPSLYMGCFIFLLAAAGLNPISKSRKRAWLARLFLFFAIASFGWYGPVWLVKELFPNQDAIKGLGAPVGGLYWLMVVFLPKYVTFRYPAKLFTIAALAIAILAGLNLDQLNRRLRNEILFRLSLLLTLNSFLLLAIGQQLMSVTDAQANPLFGPFDEAGCLATVRWAGIAAILVSTSCGIWIWLLREKRGWRLQVPILLICVADILVANAWLIPMVDHQVFDEPSQWASLAEGNTPHVVYRPPITGRDAWKGSSSENRLTEIVQWQRESLFPKHHLNLRIQLFGSFASVEPRNAAIDFRPRGCKIVGEDVDGNYVMLPDDTSSPRDFLSVIVVDSRESDSLTKTYLDVDRLATITWANENQFVIELDNSYHAIQGYRLDRLAELTLRLSLPGVSGWSANAVSKKTGRSVPAKLKVNDLTQEISLPPNEQYTITFAYRPWEFIAGAWISVVTWIALIGFTCIVFAKNRRSVL